MVNPIEYYDYDKKKMVVFNAYAFIDEMGHCIIIVAGEKRRDQLSEYLSEKICTTKQKSASVVK